MWKIVGTNHIYLGRRFGLFEMKPEIQTSHPTVRAAFYYPPIKIPALIITLPISAAKEIPQLEKGSGCWGRTEGRGLQRVCRRSRST